MMIEKYFGIDREIVQQMIDATKTMTNEKSGDNGFQNTKVFLFDEYAVLKMQNINVRNVSTQDADLKHLERLANTLLDLQAKGVNVVPILAFQSDNGSGYIIQPKAKGAELYDRDKVNDKNYVVSRVEFLSKVPQEHFDKYIADTIKIIDAGVIVDFVGKDNFFYDETIGFQFIDLNAHDDYEYGLTDKKVQGKQAVAYGCFLPCYFDTVPKYRDTVSKIFPELTEKERALLKEHNRNIFEKCKTAMINNGIAEETVNEIIAGKEDISRMQHLELL
jgi:hypothetical protein